MLLIKFNGSSYDSPISEPLLTYFKKCKISLTKCGNEESVNKIVSIAVISKIQLLDVSIILFGLDVSGPNDDELEIDRGKTKYS